MNGNTNIMSLIKINTCRKISNTNLKNKNNLHKESPSDNMHTKLCPDILGIHSMSSVNGYGYELRHVTVTFAPRSINSICTNSKVLAGKSLPHTR